MPIGVDYLTLFAYLFALLFIFIVARLLFLPIKWLLKLIYNALIGGIILWVLNVIGGNFGITVAINPFTALLVGFLGIPGVVLLLILQYLLV